MKIFKYALCFAATAIMPTACGSVKTVSFEPTVSSIFLKRDLSAKSAIIEDATAAYYNEEELKTFVQGEVDKFNAGQTKPTVKIESTAIKDNKFRIVFDYEDLQSLLSFSVESGDENMGLTSLRLLKYKDIDSSIEITDTSGIKKGSNVAVLEGKVHAYTESKILYINGEGVDKLGDYEFETTNGKNVVVFE